ncbi:kinase-like domain-containing protein [Xylaria longipes]|nr:kinase-like domain-containing protein [Xylaria longipes]
MPNCRPIAQIFCRYIEKPLPRHIRPGRGFIDTRARRDKRSIVDSCASLDVLLFPGQTLQVGRDLDHSDIAIIHPYISRHHFVVYSIEYEQGIQPLVYVRDCNSLSGTFIDCHSSPRMKLSSSSGYLLSQDEVIRLDPYWEFHIFFLDVQPIGPPTSGLRSSETDLFRNRYFITGRILGSGASAGIHLAVNIKMGRQVACKIHRLDGLRQSRGSLDIIRRILDETNILSRLTHPNLLRFEAAFRSSNALYTFTELATGGDLFSMRLKHWDGLLEMDAKIIIRQILEAVSYLHEQNVAHRDLKPENVFFATGPTHLARVIVGDLGFAKVATLGRMVSNVGTERYTAPEVHRGEPYGTKVDIWSIGMISLFLVAFDWNSLGCFETFDQNDVDEALKDVFGDLSRRHKALSDNFEDFIRACLVVSPSKRMTADDSKGHNWFRSSRNRLKAQIEEFTRGWEPARVVHNSVEDLSLFENTNTQTVPFTAPSSKRKAGCGGETVMDFQVSRYFADGNLTRHKRQKAVPPLVVTRPSGERNLHLGI